VCGISAFAAVAPEVEAATPLSAYNADPGTVTVAGISSGGFMAVQLQVAYSKSIFGTAVFAGGPYYCAQDSSSTAQGYCESGNGIPLQTLIDYTNNQASSGTIDPTSNIAKKPIYMFSGTNDTTVHQPVMNTLEQYYENYTSSSNITYDHNSQAAHAWISPDGPNSCNSSFIPYINNCGIDAEQTFLTNFYGNLNPKSTGTLTGSYIQFDQNSFISGGNANSYSMDSMGWLFVPQNCANGQVCRLVVALHGCLQYQGIIQQQFVQKSGINEWADTNNIIVLYPQATSSSSGNPLGCWDWWGYSSSGYALKSAPQMKAIMAMVTQITSGYKASTGVPAAPTGLAVSGTTASSVSLTWNAASGATSYNVYRDGSEVGSVNSTSYTDSGLSAKTSYNYAVTAVNSAGESAQSSAVIVTTQDTSGGGIPAAPSGLTVSSTTTRSVTLVWNASTGATGYNVYRSGNEVGSSASTSYTDNGLSAGTAYIYAVTAMNSFGESTKSQTVKAATQPQAVTAPVATHYADGRITLAQFLQLGQEYGYNTTITLYLCGSSWTNSSTCGPLH
jgi:poly(3-hydroxybutyrate) depolymerase